MHPPCRRASVLFALTSGLALLTAPTARAAAVPAARRPVVAVLPLRALGAPPESALALETTLRNEVATLPEVQLASSDAVATALRRQPDCLAQIACAAAAAASAGAQELIAGTISSLGDAYTLDLKLVDARTGRELGRATHPFSGRQAMLIELLRGAAVELLAPARYTGQLAVALAGDSDGAARGAQLFIDGKERGTLPLATPIAGLVPGEHTLRVAKQGFLDATLFVEVRFDQTTEARIDVARGAKAVVSFVREHGEPQLDAQPGTATPLVLSSPHATRLRAPWLKIAGWSGVGLSAVTIAAGLAFHVKAYAIAADLNRRSASNQLTAADRASFDEIGSETNTARVLYVVGGVLAAGGAGVLLYDRHLDQSQVQISASPAPSGGAVLVSGKF